jgi:AraC-like DNA-binding protein
MEVTTIPPDARLAPFVERFLIVESAFEVTRVLLPNHGLILGVRYRGAATELAQRAIRLPGSALTGLLPSVRHMRTHANSAIVLAMFRPAGAARFFAMPLHELFGTTIPLDALVPRGDVHRLAERVAAQPDHARRVAVVEQFLLARMTVDPADPIAGAAVGALEAARGSLRIATLADGLGISLDALEKRFRRAIGTSPKHLASLLRVQHAIDLARSGATWSRIAHQVGYFDQPHFIREFRAITGEAPAKFFRDAAYCGPRVEPVR